MSAAPSTAQAHPAPASSVRAAAQRPPIQVVNIGSACVARVGLLYTLFGAINLFAMASGLGWGRQPARAGGDAGTGSHNATPVPIKDTRAAHAGTGA